MNHHLALLVATTLVFAASLMAQGGPGRPPLVRENATVTLGPHSYVIPDGGVGQVPNVGIVVGSRASLVIDPGLGRRNGETVLRELTRLQATGEMYLASTHYHVEHTTGLAAFPSTARYVNSTVQEEDYAQGAADHASRFMKMSPVHAELLRDMSRRTANITFDREYLLDLGGVRVRFLALGPTHTRGDTAFFVEGDNVLYAGDLVMNNSFVAANQDSSIQAWLEAFDMLEKMGPRVIVPAHGPVGEGSLIGVNRGVLRAIHDRVRQLKAEHRPIDEVVATVQSEMQAKYPTFERANGVAGAARAAYAAAP
jgi:glyoxylase-like metal-dependent hydrolase (beta-lactamase superfamily II)